MDARLEKAMGLNILDAAHRAGARLKKVGAVEHAGPCPACGGTDRFAVNTKDRVFNCRGGGDNAGGNIVTMIRHIKGLDFDGALEWLTGDKRPARNKLPNSDNNLPNEGEDSLESANQPWDAGDTPQPGDDGPSDAEREEALKREALRSPPTAVYDYRDEMGAIVSQKLRFEWRGVDGGKRKTFYQRRPARDGDDPAKVRGGWVNTRTGFERVPYRLADVQEAIADGRLVYIVEGEKKADLLSGWGLDATCTDEGAGHWAPELNQYFRGADVVILPDNDPQSRNTKTGALLFHKDGRPRIPGKDHAQAVGRALRQYAKRVRVLDIPGLPVKGDVVDWAAAGGTAEALVDMVAADAKAWAPERPGTRYGAMLWSELDAKGPEIEWLIDDFLTLGDRSILGGESQSGKTFLALHMAMCIATGRDFFGHKVKQGLVIYQAGESAKGAKKRMRAWRRHFNVPADVELPFVLLTKKIDLFSDPEAAQKITDEIKGWEAYFPDDPLRLFAIDTMAKAALGAEENSAKEMGIVLDNAEQIESATGAHVMMVHHMNAQGKSLRGSTAIRANIDQVAFVSVDKETKVRTLSVEKQKEDEEASPLQFELLRIVLGQRDDGKEISSCVVLPIGEKDEIKKARREGFELKTGTQDLAFRALLKALQEQGQVAGPDVHVAAGTRVVTSVKWFAEYRRLAPYEGTEDPKQRVNSARKALKYVQGFFIKYGLMGQDGDLVWHTGKPVRGFKETFPPGESKASNVVPFRSKDGEEETSGSDITDYL